LTETGTKLAVEDGAADLEQEIGSKGARQQGAAVRGSPKKKAAVSRGRR
jgi:hypothetical protein